MPQVSLPITVGIDRRLPVQSHLQDCWKKRSRSDREPQVLPHSRSHCCHHWCNGSIIPSCKASAQYHSVILEEESVQDSSRWQNLSHYLLSTHKRWEELQSIYDLIGHNLCLLPSRFTARWSDYSSWSMRRRLSPPALASRKLATWWNATWP